MDFNGLLFLLGKTQTQVIRPRRHRFPQLLGNLKNTIFKSLDRPAPMVRHHLQTGLLIPKLGKTRVKKIGRNRKLTKLGHEGNIPSSIRLAQA
jgi:hypothetical protein